MNCGKASALFGSRFSLFFSIQNVSFRKGRMTLKIFKTVVYHVLVRRWRSDIELIESDERVETIEIEA